MNIITDEQLLETILEFCSRYGMKETRFGREATGEASLIATLRTGRKISLETANRLADFMSQYAENNNPIAPATSPDNAAVNIGDPDQSFPEGEPSGRAPAADSASAAAGVNLSADILS